MRWSKLCNYAVTLARFLVVWSKKSPLFFLCLYLCLSNLFVSFNLIWLKLESKTQLSYFFFEFFINLMHVLRMSTTDTAIYGYNQYWKALSKNWSFGHHEVANSAQQSITELDQETYCVDKRSNGLTHQKIYKMHTKYKWKNFLKCPLPVQLAYMRRNIKFIESYIPI